MSNVDLLTRDPDQIAARISEQLDKLGRAGELTYSPTSQHSYYRDLLQGGPGSEQRLTRHREEMDHVQRERRERAARVLRSGAFEFRVEPDRTPGQGGYAAPPLWLNQLFATANRPGRVLADLISARFPLPSGVSSVNLPILTTGTAVQVAPDNSATTDQDITDAPGSSAVVPFAGHADVSLQLLEQSPAGAPLDWALFMDMSEAYDADLETALLAGTGGGSGIYAQLLGVANVPNRINVTYTNASPSGVTLDPFLGQVFAQVGDSRLRPPECWLMRSARWAWFMTSEDTANRPLGLSTQFYLGNTDDTPDPIGGFLGLPVFLDDAIPANLIGNPGAFAIGGTQDMVLGLRPSDLILLEGEPRTSVNREPLSGSLGARIEMHNYAAAITNRRPAGIGVVGGSGLAVQAGE